MMSKRAAIYARFSSDRQNEHSCADQIALCEAWAARQGFDVTARYEDAAVSGASTINRFGLASLVRDARARRFDFVLCEALDRLSRDQADLANLKKQLAFIDIGILTVQDGEVGAMHIGLKGLMGELYLADLAQKTHRGLSARVRAGASGGGRSYGYAPVPGTPGAMRIVEAEATIVRRIFAEYQDGASPREIAAGLNADRVAGPRGGRWNASTITGSRLRQNGILQNALYAGEIVWNRQRFIKDPATGKRVSRPNPEADWLRAEAAELRIVDAATFAAVSARKTARSHEQVRTAATRPRHVLSGLLKCGCCGASYTVVGRDRLGCAGFRERGDCSNGRTVERRHVEERVLAALHANLADPELLQAYILAYHERRRERASENRRDQAGLQRRLGELTRLIDRTVDMMLDEDSAAARKPLSARLHDLGTEKDALEARLAAVESEDTTVALHPGAAGKYARLVTDLRARLETLRPGSSTDAVMAEVRKLIEKVVVTPPKKSKEPVDLAVHGLLAELLIGSDGAPQYRGALVAGTGIDHNLQSTPVKMVAGGCNHHYLRPTNIHFPINAKSNSGRMVAKNSSFHSVLFRTAA